MRKHGSVKRIVAAALSAAVLSVTLTGCVMPWQKKVVSFAGKDYSLVFNDDFNFLNPFKWGKCPPQPRQDAGGWWKPSCSKVEKGNLVLTSTMDDKGTPISGAIQSRRIHSRVYGLYHMRFKADKTDGLWNAFWLLSDQMNETTVGNGATDGAELDIFELLPHKNEFGMTVYWDGYGDDLQGKGEHINVSDDFYNDYHEVWYLWDSEGYHLYLDGTDEEHLIFDFDGDEYGEGTCAAKCNMILSTEFGTWGGDIQKEQLPSHFYVDYVQVYEEVK